MVVGKVGDDPFAYVASRGGAVQDDAESRSGIVLTLRTDGA